MPVLRTVVISFKRFFQWGLLFLAFVLLVQRSDLEQGDQVEKVQAFTRHIEFDFVNWTWDALLVKVSQISLGAVDYVSESQQSDIVLDYLDHISQMHQLEREINQIYSNPSITDPVVVSSDLRKQHDDLNMQVVRLAPVAEAIFQNQLSTIAADLGLTLGGQPIPPVMYHISAVPRGLVVSPRDTIRQDAIISIFPDITVNEQEILEKQVDQALDVSSLVVGIGGIGLYPTMVMETTNINWLSEVVSHEWVHNFLTLRPLGASYGVSPEMRIINETVANLAEKEIGGELIKRFYQEYIPPPPPTQDEGKESHLIQDPPPFDFRTEMHTTRVGTDALLEEGQIEEAEAYMERRRQVFWDNGYQIRKLNQAYFAFYGAYADEPGGASGAAEDPIGDAVRKLRDQSPSLQHFLNTISWMWSFEQLQAAVLKAD